MCSINLWEKYTKYALDSVTKAMVMAGKKSNTMCSLLLIDNASTDETQVRASAMVAEFFVYHRNEDMWGFQKSVNYGVKYFFDKGFDYVLVLNNDIVLHPRAIVRLVERMQKGGVGMATCMDVSGEMKAEQMEPQRIAELSDGLKEQVPEAEHPCFSAFMINKDCWEHIGEMDEIFHPAFYEDNDYHYRMQLAGLPAIVYPPAMFYHYGSRTQLEALGRPLTDSSNQHAQFIRKWGGDPTKEVYKTPYNDQSKSITSTKQNS